MQIDDQRRHSPTLEEGLATFLRALEGKNRSEATIGAYRADVTQFLTWLHDNNDVATTPAQVEKADITEYLASLSARKVSGVSRARKLAAIREYFRHLLEHEMIEKSPAASIQTPKKEKNGRAWLTGSEYRSILALAGSNTRDFAILQVFLQTGVRVSELCNLRLEDIDLKGRALFVREGKGQVARTVELEKKVSQAIKNYLAARPQVLSDHLFLNRDNAPFSRQGIGKLVRKYIAEAGITKKAGPHSLRHTFATHKAPHVSTYRLQSWLGHASLDTTQIYVHIGRENALKEMEATSL